MFEFPIIDRSLIKEYKGNFLRSVMLQIKYPKCTEIASDREYVASLFKSILPRINDVKTGSLRISFNQNDKNPVLQPIPDNSLGFEMKSNDGAKILVVLEDSLNFSISGSVYENFDQIQNEILLILNILEKNNVQLLSRIGIKKINIVDFSLEGNDKISFLDVVKMILNPKLVNGIDSFPKSSSISQNINTINYSEGEDRLNLIYGLLKPSELDFKNGQVVIDIDLFNSSITPISELINTSDSINKEIFNVFNWSLSETFLNLLND